MCHPEQTADLIGPYPVSVLRQLRHRGDSSSSCKRWSQDTRLYEGRTESHEQLFFACELVTADEGQCGGRWNQLLCYP